MENFWAEFGANMQKLGDTMFNDFPRVTEKGLPLLWEGLKITILVSLASIAIGLVIGLFTCLLKMSKHIVLRGIANVYIWIIRGTPMLVQAYIVYFALPAVLRAMIAGYKPDIMRASIITLSLNAGAYLAEIFRGGIMAVPKGQNEAARSLGLTRGQAMRKVVLPQAFKFSIPSLVNQFIITVKDTSILSAIALPELVNKAKTYVGKSYAFFATYIYVALFYLVIISILMIISNYIEKKLKYEGKKRRRDENK